MPSAGPSYTVRCIRRTQEITVFAVQTSTKWLYDLYAFCSSWSRERPVHVDLIFPWACARSLRSSCYSTDKATRLLPLLVFIS
jgi:hypothetical protein